MDHDINHYFSIEKKRKQNSFVDAELQKNCKILKICLEIIFQKFLFKFGEIE